MPDDLSPKDPQDHIESLEADADVNPDSPSTIDETGAYHSDPPTTQEVTAPYTPGEAGTGERRDSRGRDSRGKGAVDLPTIVGYDVTREIARGGMGRVLEARDLTLDREVAIKVLLPSSSPDAAARFVIESKVTARLPHPGIPPVYTLGELAGGEPFLSMKLVRGQTLADMLKQRESPADDLARWVGVFEQICQAVGFAHSQGILHRDLKPANVMVGAFGEVHVMDWGLAKEIHGASNPSELPSGETSAHSDFKQRALEPSATAAGQVMGTPQFMAPEQARAEILDARGCVWPWRHP